MNYMILYEIPNSSHQNYKIYNKVFIKWLISFIIKFILFVIAFELANIAFSHYLCFNVSENDLTKRKKKCIVICVQYFVFYCSAFLKLSIDR